jgi:hypothetical protein
MNTPKYWIVGAMWGGHEDQSLKFLLRGYWLLGWSDADQPEMAALRDQISVGDRIASKEPRSKLRGIVEGILKLREKSRSKLRGIRPKRLKKCWVRVVLKFRSMRSASLGTLRVDTFMWIGYFAI